MKIDKKFIKHIAKLAKIRLTDEQVEKFPAQMKTILKSADILQRDDKISQKRYNTIDFEGLRDDVAQKSQPIEDALKNAPYSENGYVKVLGSTFEEN